MADVITDYGQRTTDNGPAHALGGVFRRTDNGQRTTDNGPAHALDLIDNRIGI